MASVWASVGWQLLQWGCVSPRGQARGLGLREATGERRDSGTVGRGLRPVLGQSRTGGGLRPLAEAAVFWEATSKRRCGPCRAEALVSGRLLLTFKNRLSLWSSSLWMEWARAKYRDLKSLLRLPPRLPGLQWALHTRAGPPGQQGAMGPSLQHLRVLGSHEGV